MKIVIDCRWIFRDISGIGRYTGELVDAFSRIDGQNQYVLLFNDPQVMGRFERLVDDNPRFSSCFFSHGPFSPLTQVMLPLLLLRLGADVFFSPNFMIPFLCVRTKVITTIHDLIPLLFPQQVKKSLKSRFFAVFCALIKKAAKSSSRIVAVSDHTRKDIIEHLGVDANKVVRIYNGYTKGFTSPQRPAVWDKLEGKRKILYVGRWDPYKNLTSLVRAFAALKQDTAGFNDVVLVFAGKQDKRYPEPIELAKQLGVAESVFLTSYLTDDELAFVYQNSDMVVLPSLYEGFGLSVLEAFGAGCPIAVSNAASIPEVAGAAAEYFDPSRPEEITNAIRNILTDSVKRDFFVSEGRKRLEKFNWQTSAREHLEVFYSVLK